MSLVSLIRRDNVWMREKTHKRHVRTNWPSSLSQLPLAGRGRFFSPLHGAMAGRGSFLSTAGGWERPQFFLAEEGEALGLEEYDWYGFYGQAAHENYRYKEVLQGEVAGWRQAGRVGLAVREEMEACRRDVVIFDTSSFGKLSFD